MSSSPEPAQAPVATPGAGMPVATAVRDLELPTLLVRATGRTTGPEAVRGAAEQGFAAGFAAGYAEGVRRAGEEAAALARRREAEAQAARSATARAAEQALGAMHAAAARLGGTLDDVLAGLGEQLAGAAVDIAQVIVQAELQEPTRRARSALTRALAGVGTDGTQVVLRMHPQDARTLADLGETGDEVPHWHDVTVVPDPRLRPGDAIAEAGAQWVDARVEEALRRARAAAAAGDEAAEPGADTVTAGGTGHGAATAPGTTR